MGLFDLFRKKPNSQNYTPAPTMRGKSPFYSEFGDNVYASELVVQAIRCKANEFKKLKPRHIRDINGNSTSINDSSIAKVLNNPNPYMTTSDFLEKCCILLELNKNCFIYPEYYITRGGEKFYTAMYPLKPSNVEYVKDKGGKLYINLKFNNGYEVTLPVGDVIHWRKDYGVDDYFGGNGFGDRGRLQTLSDYQKLIEGISKAVECSCQINGILKLNSYLNDEKIEQQRLDFENRLNSNESGLLVTDLKTEYVPIAKDVKLVDAETIKFFYENIIRENGASISILNGDYTKSQKEAYYEHALEADIISLGQAFTKCFFSDREQSFGNKVIMFPNAIEFMTTAEKISALQTGLPAGIFTKNEARELLGYPPVENGDVMPRGYNEVDDKENAPKDDEQDIDDNNSEVNDEQ